MEQEAIFVQVLSVHKAAEGEQLGVVRSSENFVRHSVQPITIEIAEPAAIVALATDAPEPLTAKLERVKEIEPSS